jgi:hypothetical protein
MSVRVDDFTYNRLKKLIFKLRTNEIIIDNAIIN